MFQYAKRRFSDCRTNRLHWSRAIDGSALFKRRDKCVYGARNRDWSAVNISYNCQCPI